MSTTEFRCANQRQAGQLVSIDSPPGENPSEAEAWVSRERPTRAAAGQGRAGQTPASVYLCLRYPRSQPGRDPAPGPELVTHPSLAKSGRGWAGGGEGK